MGMFDSFYFAKGFLPNDKAPEDHEYQTKDLDCDLDIYKVDSQGSVRKFVYDGDGGRAEETKPINDSAVVYSREFLYDNPSDLFNRKYIGCKYQEYKIVIVNSKIAHVEKLCESGYEPETNASEREE